MKKKTNSMSRRHFLAVSGAMAGTTMLDPKSKINAATNLTSNVNQPKQKVAMVGTGVRGIGMWGTSVVRDYSDQIEFVGLCDSNPGRLAYAKKTMGVSCPTYSESEFDKMMKETKPDSLIVTTTDDTHDYYVNRGMELGANIICEKPMAIDEKKLQDRKS